MMMMQGILPALDPDAMLNLAISLSMQEGVCILRNTTLCLCVHTHACVRMCLFACVIYTCMRIYSFVCKFYVVG